MHLGSLLPLLLAAPAAAQDAPPNIVFIFSDDHAAHAISAYGSTRNVTPSIDRLAREGMLFENCFCGNSICGPSRATVLTGLHSHANGFLTNGDSFDGAQQTMPKLLQGAGYQTAMIGKWHLVSDPTGFDHWEVLIGQGPYYNPPMKSAAGTVKHEGYTTEVITDLALDWLAEGRDEDKPFLLMYQHKAPHRNWQPGPKQLARTEVPVFEEPATLFDDWANRNSGCQTQTMTIAGHMSRADLKLDAPRNLTPDQLAAWNKWYDPLNQPGDVAFLGSDGVEIEGTLEGEAKVRWRYQRYMQDYMACIDSLDHEVGRVLDYLDEAGLAENTIVVYSSDQGFYLGEHGWYDKRWMYEESLRMPLLVRWPGRVAAGSRDEHLVQNIDFAPTLLELAGVTEIPVPMHGVSIAPLLRGAEPTQWRQSIYYHYYEFPGAHSVPRHHGVRTQTHKLIRYEELDEWELFDLVKDPDELRSVHGRPDYAAVQAGLEEELRRLQVHYAEPDPFDTADRLNQKRARNVASKAPWREVFLLIDEADLVPSSSPIGSRAFTVGALVEASDGVVVAQGGASFGFALELAAGVPTFTVTNRDVRFVARSKARVRGETHLAASVDLDGRLRLYVDGTQVASVEGRLLEQQPADGLSLGRDSGSHVGTYADDRPLQGAWSQLRLVHGCEEDLAAWARAARGR